MLCEIFKRYAHSAGPEFLIWSSEIGIAVASYCPQTVYMLQINVDWTPSGAKMHEKTLFSTFNILMVSIVEIAPLLSKLN